MSSRKTIIDFAASVALHHGVDGPTIRRLMRLVERYRSGKDEGAALDRLTGAIHRVIPRAEITFIGTDEVYIDGYPVPQ